MEREQDWRNFIVFLHKEGAYKEFREESYRYWAKAFYKHTSYQDYMSDIKSRRFNYLTASFTWSQTRLGGMFWVNLNKKYVREVVNKDKEDVMYTLSDCYL